MDECSYDDMLTQFILYVFSQYQCCLSYIMNAIYYYFACIFRVEEEPSGARTWVASSGTENSVFSWSVWRRLPLHEVRASFRVLLCALSIL